MKVAHIAFQYGLNNTGGAAIAATRLHQALLARGVESHYICIHQREPGVNVHVLPQGWQRSLFFVLTKITRCFWKGTPYRRSICLNIVPMFGLEKLLLKIKPDIVHVQWLNADVASFERLAKLPYKMVFNLHDLFVINAIQPYPCKDRRFVTGFDKTNSTWLERWLFMRKRRMVEACRPVFIGPSRWVCDECRRSIIGRDSRAFALPNIIDNRFYRGMERPFPPNEKFVILFGAYGGRGNKLKGFDDLVRALDLLPLEVKEKCELRIFGEIADDCKTGGVQTHFLGPIRDPDLICNQYRTSDVLAFPSREETQGMTKVEAMLCGLPVIAFDRTACAEGIEHGKTGWVAAHGRIEGFVAGIVFYFNEWQKGRLSFQSRTAIGYEARSQFDEEKILDCILKTYATV